MRPVLALVCSACLIAVSACASTAGEEPAGAAAPDAPPPRSEPGPGEVVWGAGSATNTSYAPRAARPAPVRFVNRSAAAPSVASARVAPNAATAVPLRTQLRQARVSKFVVADEESLSRVVDIIRDATGLPLVVAPAAENAVLDAGVVFDFDFENPIVVKDLLNLIQRQADDEIDWVVRHDAVIFTTPQKAAGAKVLRVYDIQTLTFARTDFSGPRIDRIRLLGDIEDDDGGGPFGSVGERIEQVTSEEVMELVQEHVAPGSWDLDGVTIDIGEGSLIVVQTPEIQAQVARFLQQLGAY